jgi:hypothetical protein
MTQNLMSDEEIQQALDELNAQNDVENARIVTFMNEPHIHIDYTDGNIGVVSPDGSSISVIEG